LINLPSLSKNSGGNSIPETASIGIGLSFHPSNIHFDCSSDVFSSFTKVDDNFHSYFFTIGVTPGNGELVFTPSFHDHKANIEVKAIVESNLVIAKQRNKIKIH